MSDETAKGVTTIETEPSTSRRPFRAADVLTGTIDKRRQTAAKTRKQISAQLDSNQLRILGELHARLNATADKRIEKSDLVGLGIELLAAVLKAVDAGASPQWGEVAHRAERGLDPAPDGTGRGKRKLAVDETPPNGEIRDVDDIRSYLRTHVRAYAEDRR
jgi:hypothetical protein